MADLITAEQARALREAATPGPWVVEDDGPEYGLCVVMPSGTSACVGAAGGPVAALIAAAPDLAATVEALHAEVARLRAEVDAARDVIIGAEPVFGYHESSLSGSWTCAFCGAEMDKRLRLRDHEPGCAYVEARGEVVPR